MSSRKIVASLSLFWVWILFLPYYSHSYKPSKPEVCKELGEYRYAREDDKYRRNHILQMHVFHAPAPNDHLYLDVPPKNGNHNWGGLFYKLWHQRPPPNFDAVRDRMDQYSQRDNYTSADSIWLVTRSPYVRILSTYLEKVNCPDKVTPHHYLGGFQIYKGLGRLTFEQFLINLTSRLISAAHVKKHVKWKTFRPDSYNDWRQLRGIPSNTTIYEQQQQQLENRRLQSGTLAWGWDSLVQLFEGREAQRRRREVEYKRTMEYLQRRYGSMATGVDEYNQTMFMNCQFTMSTTELNSIIDPTGKVQRGLLPSDAQLLPIERGARLCALDHHLCLQSVGLFKQPPGEVRILKLEHQGSWFHQFAACFGVEAADIIGRGWQEFSKQPCFYTPTGRCEDALTPVDAAALAKGGVHGIGTVNFMAAHYTPLAAKLVDYLYEYDFYTLGYRRWDGKSPFSVE